MVCIESKFADVVARAFFERWICRFSVPKLLMSDQGREFDNEVMDELCLIFGVKKKRTSPYHPETNAQAEVYNKTIKYMKAQLDNDTMLDWEEHIPALALAYNSHVHSSTRETPFYLMYLHDPRLPWFDLEKPRAFYTGSYPSEAFSNMQQCFQRVKENLGDAVAVQKAYFDRKTKEKTFAPGDRVMVWHAMLPKNVNPKFYKKWRYAKIVKMIGPLNVQVLDENDRKKPYIIHVNRVVMATSQQIREDCDSILSPYEDDIQTGVAQEEQGQKGGQI
jgi:hypothetical protein